MAGEDHVEIEPDQVRAGTAQLVDAHGALKDILKRLDGHYENLRGTWSGSASDAIQQIWAESHPAIVRTADELAAMASKVNDAADSFDKQDGTNADQVDAVDIPDVRA